MDSSFISIVVIILGLILFFDLFPFLTRRISEWRERNKPPEFYDFAFDEDHAAFSSATVDVKVAWTEFTKVYEDQYSFLLMLKNSKKEYWTIPKQYFASAHDLNEFQRLLEAHISPP